MRLPNHFAWSHHKFCLFIFLCLISILLQKNLIIKSARKEKIVCPVFWYALWGFGVGRSLNFDQSSKMRKQQREKLQGLSFQMIFVWVKSDNGFWGYGHFNLMLSKDLHFGNSCHSLLCLGAIVIATPVGNIKMVKVP